MELPTSIATLLQEILSAKRIGQFLKARDVDYLLEPATDSNPIPEVGEEIYIHGTVTWNIPHKDLTPDSTIVSDTSPVFSLQDVHLTFPRGKMSLVAGKFGSGKSLLLLALLGEARLVQGQISYLLSEVLDPKDAKRLDWSVKHSGVAYVPQVSV